MVNKKDLVVVALATFCLTSTLFIITSSRSLSPSGVYDPMVDLNDDGQIDILDAIILAGHFGTSGTPITKNALRTIRFYTPNETVSENAVWKNASTFVWTPNNPTNNAILEGNFYFQAYSDVPSIHLCVNVLQNDRVVYSDYYYVYSSYNWSGVKWFSNCQANQKTYTIVVQINSNDGIAGFTPMHVKDVNLVLEIIDGLQPS